MHVRKGDTVIVIAGDDRGKQGEVIEAKPRENKVKVQNVALVKKHEKARQRGESSGIKEYERFIDASNVKKL